MGDHEGADITYAHMIAPEEEPSKIQEYYKGSVIFITGGSGFLGTLLIEKLLRSCHELSRIYVLMREKRGIGPQRRLENLCNDNIFERVLQEQPNCFEKLFVIKGDCELPDLGLSEDDRDTLIEEVDIVFHTAAALRFNEKLKTSVLVNVKCTGDLLKLARSMHKLRSFVHVSSAFVHCIRKEIDECFYDSPIDAEKLISIVDVLNDRQVDLITPALVEPWPNTFVYTKAVAESVIRTYGKGLPISIHRPSIIISTTKEPVCGWMNNLYGIAWLVAQIGLGIMHVLYTEPELRAELVPADYCTNAMIVSAWQSGSLLCDNLNQETVNGQIVFDEFKVQDNIPIYNFISSVERPITWGEMRKLSLTFATKTPCNNAMYHVFLIFTKNTYLFRICRFLFHTLQCVIMESLSGFFGMKLQMKKTYKKIDEMSNTLNYYMTEQWIFRNKNTRTLWKQLNSTDRKLFEFSMESFNWVSYFYTFVRGTRTYLLKDSLETVNNVKRKYKMFKYVHYTIITVVSMLFIQIFLWLCFLIL